MSISDVEKVDGIGISKDRQQLDLLITDHLDWENEYDHLILLQDKINAYLGFIESNQYLEIYPGQHFASFNIEIHFKYGTTPNCIKFIEYVDKQIVVLNISIRAVI